MGGKNLALYTLKPNVSVSISRRLDTCRVLNFKVQAVNCTVRLMQGCNHTAMVKAHSDMIRKELRSPHFREAEGYSPSLTLTLRGEMYSCITFLHTMVTRRRQCEEHGNQQRLPPAKVTFLPPGKKQWLSCSRESTSFSSTTRLCYIFQLAAAAQGTVQRDHKRAWCTAAAGSWQQLLEALRSYSTMG